MDEIVPCLKDNETREIKETAVFKIESRSFLDNFTAKKGWVINWSKIPKEIDVGYALNKELLNHYIEVLGCFFVGIRHPYHFLLEPKSARKLLENYTYEWK